MFDTLPGSITPRMNGAKLEVEGWKRGVTEKNNSSFYVFGDMRKHQRNLRKNRLFIVVSLVVILFVLYKFNYVSISNISPPFSSNKVPLIIVITPTYKRPTRLADLTRMSNTLSHVPHLHWIVVEDSHNKVKHVEKLLQRSTLPYTYIAVRTIPGYPKRGWYQRTMALTHIREHTSEVLNGHENGVVYFGDDDNSYDVRLFTNYIRNVKKVGLWAVGMVGGTAVESPDVVNGSVVGFKVKWNPNRKFAVDMAGFAINLSVVLGSSAVFGTSCARGAGAPETCLLEDMGLTRGDIEPFGYDKKEEREILVWHTKTVKPTLGDNKSKGNSTAKNNAPLETNGFIFEA
ncbi:unnamed protein product [Caenorhabditis auriculariae]|uniref:Galactosylgalactosylxylosylprotein 3-beta-glucuronosyltransferase n=1 Tax=Caenorhabditis auriculariae TaxID=2777116 RepID=A0A8S1H717_9PELO|nr:unnamed protein product [Caenorhabditis auriculariae]